VGLVLGAAGRMGWSLWNLAFWFRSFLGCRCFGLWSRSAGLLLATDGCASTSWQSHLKSSIRLCLSGGFLSCPSGLIGSVAHHEVQRPQSESDQDRQGDKHWTQVLFHNESVPIYRFTLLFGSTDMTAGPATSQRQGSGETRYCAFAAWRGRRMEEMGANDSAGLHTFTPFCAYVARLRGEGPAKSCRGRSRLEIRGGMSAYGNKPEAIRCERLFE